MGNDKTKACMAENFQSCRLVRYGVIKFHLKPMPLYPYGYVFSICLCWDANDKLKMGLSFRQSLSMRQVLLFPHDASLIYNENYGDRYVKIMKAIPNLGVSLKLMSTC